MIAKDNWIDIEATNKPPLGLLVRILMDNDFIKIAERQEDKQGNVWIEYQRNNFYRDNHLKAWCKIE